MDESFHIQNEAKKHIPETFSTECKKIEALFAYEFGPACYRTAEGAELIDHERYLCIDFVTGLGSFKRIYNQT